MSITVDPKYIDKLVVHCVEQYKKAHPEVSETIIQIPGIFEIESDQGIALHYVMLVDELKKEMHLVPLILHSQFEDMEIEQWTKNVSGISEELKGNVKDV